MRAIVVTIALALLLTAGCGAQQRPAEASDPGYQTVVSRTDINGNSITATAATRATVVIVFASWCRPCRQELAILSEIVREQPGIRVIGVNAYEDWDDLSDQRKLESFLREKHPWLTVVRSDPEILRSLGGVKKIPSLFLFDQRGEKVKVFRRAQRQPPTKSEIEQALAPLLG